MSQNTQSFRFKVIGAAALIILGGSLAHAGGGLVIGKVAGDLTERFGKAVNPTIPPKTPIPTLGYRPPELVPGGGSNWSTGQVSTNVGPLESASGVFNRGAADRSASSALTDLFNHARRAFD